MIDKESLTSIENDVQIDERAKHAMETYFGWLQKSMATFPWSNTNLNRILLSNATKSITATLAFVQKLSQAKNFEEVVKLQTEFMGTQMNSFNEQSKVLSEIYTKAAGDAMNPLFDSLVKALAKQPPEYAKTPQGEINGKVGIQSFGSKPQY